MAASVAEQLAPRPVTAVYTSPIRRCRETARILSEAWGVKPVVRPGLTEADYGRWSGRSLESLARLKAWQQLMASPARFRFPEGETLEEVRARAVATIEELAQRHRNDEIAVVTHADVIRVLVGHYLGAPLDLIHRLDVRPVAVSVVELGRDGTVRVPTVNAGPGLEAGRWH
jgi:broad specificity phosphatase PhoE